MRPFRASLVSAADALATVNAALTAPAAQPVRGNDWTVRAADYDRLYLAALDLRHACKDRLPPGHYDKVSEECREIDAAIAQRDAARAQNHETRENTP